MESLVREAIGLLWGGDEDRLGEIVHPDYRDHAAAGVERGRASFASERRALRQAFADVEVTPGELVVADGHAAVRVRFRGLHVGSHARLEPCGRTLVWDEIHIWRLHEGRVIEHWAARNDLLALCRMGAVLTWPDQLSSVGGDSQ